MIREFVITAENPAVRAQILPVSSQDGIDLYRVEIDTPDGMPLSPVKIEWEEEMYDTLSIWAPQLKRNRQMKQWFLPTVNQSTFYSGAPILTTVGAENKNALTVAVSDVCTPTEIAYWIKDLDEQDKLGYSVSFFTGNCSWVGHYTAEIRIDNRRVPYYEAIPAVSRWWEKDCGYTFLPMPPAAEDALYSSWYSFHQAPKDDLLLKDLELAAEMGMKTVILDDGWQFPGPSSGTYSECGTWQMSPDKFADFKTFVRKVHELGMKIMVWFCVPFVGINSPVFKQFEGKYLYVEYGIMECGTLDPRYPEVRDYIKNTYKQFLKDYDIDGFKLDFIDSFKPGDLTADYHSGMAYETVEEAVHTLLDEIVAELGEIKPDLLYEYRQGYVGPAINHYGNMLRVGDCAYDALTNRIGTVDLRLMDYPVAVHADMLLWGKQETPEMCARQLLNILFSVPQISVRLAEVPEEHRRLVKAYVDYWTANRDVLLHGKFMPVQPELNYTAVTAEGENKTITVLYASQPYTFTGKACDVFVCGEESGLIFENPTENALTAEIFDCFGTLLETRTVAADTIVRLPVPRTGRVGVC